MRTAALSTVLLSVLAAAAAPSSTAISSTSPPKVSSVAIRNVAAEVGTPDNPVALGSTVELQDWLVTVDSVDPDAWSKIQAENQYNDPPAEGRQLVMFHVLVTYTGDETGTPAFDFTWSIVGSAGDTFGSDIGDFCGVIPDALSDQGELFPGATASGNVCVSVAADQVAGASIVLDQFLSSTHLVLAAQAGQGTAAPSPAGTPPALATPDANAVRGTRANPFGLGEEIALGDWKLKVDSVDSDAWPEIQAVNGFNDPPADGRQFVMFHVTAANVGAEAGNPSLSPAWTVVGSRGNTFGASLSDYCGVIPDALSDQGDGGQVAAGESAAGNICVSVPIDQLDGATIQVKPAFGDPAFSATR